MVPLPKFIIYNTAVSRFEKIKRVLLSSHPQNISEAAVEEGE